MMRKITSLFLYSYLLIAYTVNAQWSGNPSVNTFISSQNGARHTIVPDNSGGAIIFWQSQNNLYAQHLDAQGISLWTNNGVLICAATSAGDVFDAIADGNGGAIVTWKDNRNATLDIYAQKISQNGIIQWIQNGVVISSATNTQLLPQLVTDGFGGAIITWQDGQNPETPQRIKAQRINSSGTVQWTTNGITICNASGFQIQTHPNITVAANGSAIISWFDFRAVASWWDVYAQKIDGNGNLLWDNNGLFIGDIIQNEESQSDITSDGSDGAIITWSDYNGTDAFDHNIHVQHITSDGVIQWPPNNNLCNMTGDQTEIRVLHDSSQNTYVVWQDSRTTPSQVYAQKFNNSGIAQWTENGIPCSAPTQGTTGFPEAISDGSGGIIIVYDADQLYAQRINSSGNLLWGDQGVIACTYGGGFGGSFETHAMANANNGVTLIWNNENVVGHSGLYAQNICGNGQLGDCTLSIRENNLNQFRLTPNPTHSILNLLFTNNQVADKVTITDLTGKTVLEQIAAGNQVNIEKLAAGVYVLQVLTGENNYQAKFVKQ